MANSLANLPVVTCKRRNDEEKRTPFQFVLAPISCRTAQRAMTAARALLGRNAGVRDTAGLTLFLCSPEADGLTGRTLTVNGAWLRM